MKKHAFIIVALLLICGKAWGQVDLNGQPQTVDFDSLAAEGYTNTAVGDPAVLTVNGSATSAATTSPFSGNLALVWNVVPSDLTSNSEHYINIANTYTGGTTISGTVESGSVLVNGGYNTAFGEGSVTLQNVTLANGVSEDGLNRATEFENDFVLGTRSSFRVRGGEPFELSGNISGGDFQLSLDGGNLIISGTNTYTGKTVIGTNVLSPWNNNNARALLTLGSTTALPTGTTVEFAVANKGTLDLGGFSATVAGLTGTGTITNSSTTEATFTLNGTGVTTNITSVFSGNTKFVWNVQPGDGTDGVNKISSANNHTGGTSLVGSAAGTKVNFENNSAFGGATATATLENVTLMNEVGADRTLANAFVLGANSSFRVRNGKTFTLSGNISGKDLLLSYDGGQLVISGTNTYTGKTVIGSDLSCWNNANSAARLTLGSNTALPTGTVVEFGNGYGGSTLDLGGFSPTVAGIAGTGKIENSGDAAVVTMNVATDSTSTPTLNLGANVTLEKAGAGSQTFGVISGAGGLNVSGGTVTLAGTNTYTGDTLVKDGGTLEILDPLTLASSLTVEAGGTLKFTDNGGVFPTLTTTGDVTLPAGSLALGDFLTLDPGTVLIDAETITYPDLQTLFVPGTPSDIHLLVTTVGGHLQMQLAVNPNAVPEPGAWLLLVLGAGLVGCASRKRKNKKHTG